MPLNILGHFRQNKIGEIKRPRQQFTHSNNMQESEAGGLAAYKPGNIILQNRNNSQNSQNQASLGEYNFVQGQGDSNRLPNVNPQFINDREAFS